MPLQLAGLFVLCVVAGASPMNTPKVTPSPAMRNVAKLICHLPQEMFDLVQWARTTDAVADILAQAVRNCDYVDIFSGSGRLSDALLGEGMSGSKFDILLNADNDILTDVGLGKVLLRILQVRRGGFFVASPPNAMWLPFYSARTKRTRTNPFGNKENLRVQDANLLNYLLAILTAICIEWGLYGFVEQPTDSLFFKTEYWTHLTAKYNLTTVDTWLGAFGHWMSKPTTLVGNLEMLDKLVRTKPTNVVLEHRWTATGKYRSAAGLLLSSQIYPDSFCRAVVAVVMECRASPMRSP
jgi:hypothetical protein